MTGAQPQDDRLARNMLLSGSRYTLLDQILYHIEDHSTLRVILSQTSRRRLLMNCTVESGALLSGESLQRAMKTLLVGRNAK